MYYNFEFGDKAYKLRLNTRSIVNLEKVLGCNPLAVFGLDGSKIPTVTTMVHILHNSLQQYHHGITLEKAFDIFDAYLESGKMPTDFILEILEIYKVSGIINADTEETEKN
jgi:hypothetical protein